MAMTINDEAALEQLAGYFKALSEPLRLKLLQALRLQARNVNDLTRLVGTSQANVSKHLSVLCQAGILKRSNQGNHVYYDIADASTYQLCDLVCGQLASNLQARVTSLMAQQD